MADRDGQDGSQRRSLIALGVVVVLFLLGWLLAHELYASGKLEDCLMSGRTNCVPLDTKAADRPVTTAARNAKPVDLFRRSGTIHSHGSFIKASRRRHTRLLNIADD